MFIKFNSFFNKLSLKRKLIVIINLVTFTTLLLGLVIIVFSEYSSTKKSITNNFIVQTKLVGDYCVTPLVFFDKKGTREILDRLNSLPEVQGCFVFDENGALFAEYKRDSNVFFIKDFSNVLKVKTINNEIHISSQIGQDKKIFGTIYLIASLKSVDQLIIRYVIAGFIFLMMLLFISIIISYKLQSLISKPITDLKLLAEEISVKPDYSKRIISKNYDEIGQLYNSFNEMLEQIHKRDRAQKEIESALRESEKEKDLILYAAPVGIAIVKNDKLQWLNDMMCRLTNYSVDELMELDFENFFHFIEINGKNVNDVLSELSKSGFADFNGKLSKKDSAGTDVYCCIAPFDQNKLNLGLIIAFLDITEEKRSKEIIKNQLKDLEIKNTELERFAYTVSHDLKSPVITIKGFLGSILTDIKNNRFDRITNDINRISNAAEKMQYLLDDLLHFSRVGRIINSPSKISMSDIVKDTVELLDGIIKNSKAKIHIQENLPIILGDVPRLREAVQNLLENAIKYSANSHIPEIYFGYQIINGSDTFLVKDNGIGIKKEFQTKIFNIFEKLNTNYEGTGIGLAIAKKIIEIHNGKIWVESEGIGKGSTFYFTLNET